MSAQSATQNVKVGIEQGGDRGFVKSGGELDIESGGAFKIAGTAVTSTAAQLNALAPLTTAVAAELDAQHGVPMSATMATTPATGTCAVQLTFKDSAGVAITHAVAGLLFFSTSAGLAIAAATSNATLTNGAIQELVIGKVDLFITSAAGLLGFTVTAGAGSYYATIVLPNGKIITTAAIVVN